MQGNMFQAQYSINENANATICTPNTHFGDHSYDDNSTLNATFESAKAFSNQRYPIRKISHEIALRKIAHESLSPGLEKIAKLKESIPRPSDLYAKCRSRIYNKNRRCNKKLKNRFSEY